MPFTRVVPESVGQLKENLMKLSDNRKHMTSMAVNGLRIEVDLDRMANSIGGSPDFYMPIKSTKVKEATDLVAKFNSGAVPNDSDVSALFAVIDPSGL